MRHLVTAIVLSAILTTGTGLLAALSMSGTAFAEAGGSGHGCGNGCQGQNGGTGSGGRNGNTGLGGGAGLGSDHCGVGSGGHDLDFHGGGSC
jgi:hypothetical protein